MSGDRPAPHHWTLVICYGRITLTTHGDLLRERRIEDRLFAYGREGLLRTSSEEWSGIKHGFADEHDHVTSVSVQGPRWLD
jgi:hypothetical protein